MYCVTKSHLPEPHHLICLQLLMMTCLNHLQLLKICLMPVSYIGYRTPSIHKIMFFFCLVLQPDGVYNCKVCVEFSCSGPIPMEAHLNDKPHLDNLMRSNLKKLPLEQLTISSPTLPPQPEIQLIPTIVEKRVEKVWNHPTICGYTYDDSFSQLTTDEKIEILSPHFAFLGKEDPIPNLVKYFSMWAISDFVTLYKLICNQVCSRNFLKKVVKKLKKSVLNIFANFEGQ